MALQVSHVGKHYLAPRGAGSALSGVTFAAAPGEFVALVGPSGCGKSTLLRLMTELLVPDSGTIHFSGWLGSPKRRLFSRDHSLFPWWWRR